ncbi:MAG TPA: N-acetylmuramoyl-L-alanine amidase [Vitreimonas sp.]|nr:N-acetylmuramoyl-L-alanine amidase [Vitreimonas sp.]
MAKPEIIIKTFNDYTPTVKDGDTVAENTYYPHYTYFAHDDIGSLSNPHTVLIHSMHIPGFAHESGEASADVYEAKNYLEKLGLSCHYFIPREARDEKGDLVVYQMVQDERKAWHAGKSALPRLEEGEAIVGLNHNSLGIEIMDYPDTDFTDDQYLALVGLIAQLLAKHPIENILGHSEVSGPDIREDYKVDPVGFDWDRFMSMLAQALNLSLEDVARYRQRVV